MYLIPQSRALSGHFSARNLDTASFSNCPKNIFSSGRLPRVSVLRSGIETPVSVHLMSTNYHIFKDMQLLYIAHDHIRQEHLFTNLGINTAANG